jgi:hypothetical protein
MNNRHNLYLDQQVSDALNALAGGQRQQEPDRQ